MTKIYLDNLINLTEWFVEMFFLFKIFRKTIVAWKYFTAILKSFRSYNPVA
jgi:hypothetical protein